MDGVPEYCLLFMRAWSNLQDSMSDFLFSLAFRTPSTTEMVPGATVSFVCTDLYYLPFALA